MVISFVSECPQRRNIEFQASGSCADPFFILVQLTVVPPGPHATEMASPGGPWRSSWGACRVLGGRFGVPEGSREVPGGVPEGLRVQGLPGATLGTPWEVPGVLGGSPGVAWASLGPRDPLGGWLLGVPGRSLGVPRAFRNSPGTPRTPPGPHLGGPLGAMGAFKNDEKTMVFVILHRGKRTLNSLGLNEERSAT